VSKEGFGRRQLWLIYRSYLSICLTKLQKLSEKLVICHFSWRASEIKQKVKLFYAFFWVIPQRLNFICQRFGTFCLPSSQADRYLLPMKMEQTQCSETLAYKIQKPGNYPEESTQHSEHGESLKSRKVKLLPPSTLKAETA
jgi:hypothetical protein